MRVPFEQVKKQVLKNKKAKAAYDALESRYAIIEALIKARHEAGFSQAEIATRIGTTQSAIARLEGGRVSPSIETLFKYAKATGHKPVIYLE